MRLDKFDLRKRPDVFGGKQYGWPQELQIGFGCLGPDA